MIQFTKKRVAMKVLNRYEKGLKRVEIGSMDLYDKLVDYSQSDVYPFHMPGHKRQVGNPFLQEFPNPYAIDITEIDGFDNLHHAEGIIRESMDRAAKMYGADRSYYLVNGSSCGILSAVCGMTQHGGKILMSRNCHKAAYHGVFLNRLRVEYIYPQIIEEFGIQGGLVPEDVEQVLKTDHDIQAVLVVSPTYDGIVSDVEKIVKICHGCGIPLIVDEAHGAHFRYHKGFPVSALDLGADVVIQSLHKTLPAFTQTSILHVKGDLVDRERLEHYLQIFQSSSPSYLFMAGMERCLKFMEENKGAEEENVGEGEKGKVEASGKENEKEKTEMTGGRSRMDQFYHRLVKLRKELGAMKRLRLLEEDSKGKNGVYDLDISKVIISAKGTGINGEELGEWLRRDYHLEMEMCAAEYVTAITTVMDTEEGLRRLRNALLEIDGKLSDRVESQDCGKKNQRYELKPETVMSIADGWEQADKKISLEDSVGRISGEYIYLYPPGIPFVVPGEKISQEVVDLVKRYQKCGYSVQGMADQNCKEIRVVR